MTVPRAREHANPPSPPDGRPPRRGGGSSPSPYTYAASAAGRPAGPARLCGARRGLVRSARALAAAAPLALSGALALPGTAEAEVLVSNIGQTDAVQAVVNPVGQRQAIQFTTGDNATGYNLDSVEIPVGDYENVVVTVSLYSDSSGEPGSSTFNFTNPTSGITADAVNTFTAPANTTLAGSNTPYFIVVYGTNDPDETTNTFRIKVTSTGAEDSGGATNAEGDADWEIADTQYWQSGGSWHTAASELKFRLKGTAASGGTPQSTDATLSALSVTGGGSELVTNFASGTTVYTASVANGVEEVTVTLTKGHASATVEYLLGDDGNEDDLEDADDMEAGFQVPLAVGANRIVVGVTAEDGTTTQTYTVTVTRAAAGMTPTPTCTLNPGDLWCSVITVGENNDYYGYHSSPSQGELSSNSFMVGTSRYTIDTLSVAGSSKEDAGNLTLDLTERPSAAEQEALDRLVLHLDDDAFRLIDRRTGPPGFFYWEDSDLDWSGKDYVIARLREIPIPPGLEVTLDLSEDRPFEDTGRVTVTAMASPASPEAFTVEISASPVAPATGDDFELSANRTLSFAANATESTGTVRISPVVDEDPEPHDVVTVSGAVSNPAIPDPDDVRLTIVNDDNEAFDVEVDAPNAVDEDAGTATVTVTLTTGQNSAPVIDVELYYYWRQKTATRGDDYTPPPGEVFVSYVLFDTVPPSAFSSNADGTAWVAQRSFTIGIVDDTEAERAETIEFQVGTPSDTSPKRTIRIRDNDTPVMRNVTLVSGPGPDGVWSAGERVELEVRYSLPVVVAQSEECWSYNADGTCKPSGPSVAVAFRSDARPGYGEVLGVARVQYASGSGTDTLHFAYTVGQAEAGARGVVVVDGKVLLRGATIRPSGGGDAELSEFTRTRVMQVTVRKPGGGAWTAGNKVQVTVKFTGPGQQQNRDKVDVNKTGGTPTIGLLLGDPQNRPLARTALYEGGSGSNTLVFEYAVMAGDGRISAVEVVAGSLELNRATIRNKEGYDAELDHLGVVWSSSLALSVRDTAAPEGGTLKFAMELAEASKAPVTVDYETADGTAAAGRDYTAKRGTVTFAPGQTRKTVEVPVLRDEAEEDAETVVLRLSNVRAEGSEEPVEVTDPEAEGTIEDVAPAAPEEAPLTAEFEGLPAAHDGESGFRFRVAFSEDIGISFRSLREDAFEVAGGRVTRGRRVDDRRDLFEITVRPESDGDVTITLPAGRECAVSGAICTKGENRRQLTNTPTATVAGPDGTAANAPAEGAPTIAGTPRVGETLSASTSDITDADGLDNATFAYQWIRGGADIPGAAGASYTAVEADAGERLKVRVAFTDDAGHAESATSAATGPVEAALRANTPAEGRPEIAGKARVGETLSASTSGITDADGLDNAEFAYQWLRDGADIPGAAGGSYTAVDADAGERLKVRVDFTDGAGNGESLTSRPTSRVAARPLPKASVADARVREAAGATLDFAVTLSAPPPGPVTVDYRTLDASAKAGEDYEARAGTLSFAAGETAKTLRVTVLDDDVDEGDEKMVVVLDPGPGVARGDRLASGTIENSDPLPAAWLARFGRTASDHAVEAVEARFGDPGGGSHVTFGGRRLWGAGGLFDALPGPGGMPGDPFACSPFGGGGLSGTAPDGAPPDRGADPGTNAGIDCGTGAGTLPGMNPGPNGAIGGGMNAGLNGGMDGGMNAAMDAGMNGGMNAGTSGGINGGMGAGLYGGMDGARRGPPAAGGYRPRLRDLLLGSSFRLSAGGADDYGAARRLTAWGQAAATRFDGVAGGVSVDGEVATFLVGADAAWNRWLAGVTVAHSVGAGGFRGGPGGGAGELGSTLTAVHPYVRWQAGGRLSAWGVLGYGTGDLTLETNGSAWETDTSMRMAAGGLRGVFLRGAGGLELAARTDLRFTHIASDGVADNEAGLLAAAAGGASRLRLLVEGSRPFKFGAARMLTPTLELGVRRDGGDAETGGGIDLGGSLRYADAALGLTVQMSGRYLVAHEDDAYREWGASASVRIDPGAPGRGLTLSVTPAWGASATGGAERLWSVRDARGLGGHGFDAAMRLRAEVGYGLEAFRGAGSVTPFAGLSMAGAMGRDWRFGAQWTRGAALRMSLEATRRESPAAPPAHGVSFRLTWRPGVRGPSPAAAAYAAGGGPRAAAARRETRRDR